MAKLIVLRGNSGSGKTTVAKELQKKFGQGTMLISQKDLLVFIQETLINQEMNVDEIVNFICSKI